MAAEDNEQNRGGRTHTRGAAGNVGAAAGEMQAHGEGILQKVQERSPSVAQVVGLITLLVLGSSLLALAGVTFTGTVLTMLVAGPALLFFSPVLVPVGIVLFLAVAGFVTAGGLGMGAMSVLSWIYRYYQGEQPSCSENLDYAKRKFGDATGHMGGRAKDFASAVQHKGQETANRS